MCGNKESWGTERSENSCISSLHYTTHLKKLIHPIYYRHGNNFENPQKKYSSHQWTGIIFQISRTKTATLALLKRLKSPKRAPQKLKTPFFPKIQKKCFFPVTRRSYIWNFKFQSQKLWPVGPAQSTEHRQTKWHAPGSPLWENNESCSWGQIRYQNRFAIWITWIKENVKCYRMWMGL